MLQKHFRLLFFASASLYGISQPTYYNWKSKYGGMSSSQLKKMKEHEAELAQFKRMYADLAFENNALKNLIEKSFKVCW